MSLIQFSWHGFVTLLIKSWQAICISSKGVYIIAFHEEELVRIELEGRKRYKCGFEINSLEWIM